MNILLFVALFGQLPSVDMVVSQPGPTAVLVHPKVQLLPGETCQVRVELDKPTWWVQNQNDWYFSGLQYGKSYLVTMRVDRWYANGTMYPRQMMTADVTTPAMLFVQASGGHGCVTINITGGKGPYQLAVYGPSMRNLEVMGSITLFVPTGYYMARVTDSYGSNGGATAIVW